jgi:hydrogenase-4 component B
MMLLPQAFLAAACVALGLFPGVVLRVITNVTTSLPGVQPNRQLGADGLLMASGLESFDRVVPMMLAAALLAGLGLALLLTGWRALAVRKAPTWGCGGTLDARTEYTATAFSKPLMLIFRAVYRPARQVESLAEASPYFPREVRYHAEIEPTFERFLYGPILRGVLRVADGMKMLQAGSLHAYLGYVIALVVGLVLLVWWGG